MAQADPRRLAPDTLRGIDRDVSDYSHPLKQPRRLVRRLLDHIDSISDETTTANPGKDETP